MPKDWDAKAVASGEIIKEPLRSYYGTDKRKRTAWHSYRYRAHDEDFSNILWPTKWPKEKLVAERQRYIDSGNPEGYAQEYLNYPIDDSFAYFRKQDMLPMGQDAMERTKKYYVGVDLAISQQARADYTVFVIGGMDSDGVLHIVDVVRDRMDANDIIEALFAINKRYKPEMFAIESSMISKSIGPAITDAMMKKNEYFNITDMIPTKDKETRARSIQARSRAGGLRFNKEAEWYSDLEQEMLQFPRARHDDQVDALAWLGLIVDKMLQAPTPQEEEEDAYEEGFGLYQQDAADDGRSRYTGY
jgi:predicted phage terminase large subunit-like protein